MTKGKLQKTAENLEFTRRILTNGIWVILLVIILAAIGWYLVQKNLAVELKEDSRAAEESSSVKPVVPAINWGEVDTALAGVLQDAREEARQYAEAELDIWIASLMERIDESFLDWYFSYWTQQMLGLKGLYQYGVHYVIQKQPTASEKLTEEIQEEFLQRVLRPQIAQRVLERIINETATRYILVLKVGLNEIPQTYSISRADWQSYLEDIAITTKDSEAARQTPLTLKALTVSTTGGALLLAGSIKGLVTQAGSKVLTKSSGKVASSMAAKTGGKVVAKAGGKFFGTIAGFGVLIWDIWDHDATERENRPFLRNSLAEYLGELKSILLDDPEYGIMATFSSMEHEIVEKSHGSSASPRP